MNNWQEQDARDRARRIAQATAEREQGHRRLNAATVTVGLASVAAAGVVVAILPGSSNAAVQPAPSGSSPSAPAGNPSDDQGNQGDHDGFGSFQAPANPPQVSNGGGVDATSGATS